MIEITLPVVAWVAVVVFQAIIHFGIIPRQRRELQEDAKAEAEMLERLRSSSLCDDVCDDSLTGFGERDASNVDSSGSPGSYVNASSGRGLRIDESNSTLETDTADDDSCSSVEDFDEDEDLDCIDDGLEQSRLKLLRYYYSPNSPDMFQMEPFRSSCGSISSLDESEDPERLHIRTSASGAGTSSAVASSKSLQQPHLDQSSNTFQRPPVPNGVLRRRNAQDVEQRKDKHVGFADKAFQVHSAPVVQCA